MGHNRVLSKWLVTLTMVVALLAVALPLGVSQVEASPGTTYVPDDYPTIPAAVEIRARLL